MHTNNNDCSRNGNQVRKLLIVAIALCSSLFSNAQNLVPNPSWEVMASCPGTYQYTPLDWFNPNGASPDYFHPCAVGYNHAQPGYARTGESYVGQRFYGLGGGWYEYSQVALTAPMVAGTTYNVGVWVKGSNIPEHGFGIHISKYTFKASASGSPAVDSILPVGFRPFTTLSPQIEPTTPISSSEWTLMSGTYTATGGEKAITLGCFLPWDSMVAQGLGGGGAASFDDAYVYAQGTPNFPMAAALNFDGVDDVLNVIDNSNSLSNLHEGKFTIEAWVNSDEYYSNTPIISKEGSYNLYITNAMLVADVWNDTADAGNYTVYLSQSNLPQSGWLHVAFTYDNAQMVAMYVNGVAQQVQQYGDYNDDPKPFYIGYNARYSSYLKGTADEVRIWKRALCQPEIQNNMNAELPLPQNDLALYYKFNQGYGGGPNAADTIAIDASGYAINSRLANFGLSDTVSNWVYPGKVNTGSMAPLFVAPSISILGDTAVCIGSSLTLAAVGNATTYEWSNGPNTPNFTVSPTTATTYSVQGLDANRCTSNIATTSIAVKPLPVITVNSDTICSGSSFSIVASGADAYFYSSISDVVTPTVDTTYSVWGITYYIAGTTLIGCVSADSAISTVGVTPIPVIAIADSRDTICSGDTSSICISSSHASYLWNTGETAECIAIENANYYSVTVTDANGCSTTSSQLPVTVLQPAGVSVSIDGNTITATGSTSYQWYWNNNIIPNATNSAYTATDAGSYTVIATDANNCTAISSAVTLIATDIEDITIDQLNIYPSPATDHIVIRVDDKLLNGTCRVTDMSGREVATISLQSYTTTLPLTALASGAYNIIIHTSQSAPITRKFVIQQ